MPQFPTKYTNRQLVEQLYSTKDPSQVNQYQSALQDVQKSPQGADVASYLLQHSSKNCRYFGALTFSVVILNNVFDEGEITQIRNILHSHIQKLVQDESSIPSNMFILRKLFSNLHLLYSKYPHAYRYPIIGFCQALTNLTEPIDTMLEKMTLSQLDLLLAFSSTFVEDIFRTNLNVSDMHRLVYEELFPVFVTIYKNLSFLRVNKNLPYALEIHSLKTLSAWMLYISNVNGEVRYESQLVSSLTSYAYEYFTFQFRDDNEEYLSRVHISLRIFGDIFETNPGLLTMDEKQAIVAMLFDLDAWGTQFLQKIVLTEKRHEHEEEVNAYVDLTLTVLQYNMIKISKSILDASTQNIIHIALLLSDLNGAQFEDDFVSERMLEFWEELTNVYIDSDDIFETLFENTDPQFRESFERRRLEIFRQVCQIYWKKSHIPRYEIYTSSKAEFVSYRRAVSDFFLVAYSFLKAGLYKMLCDSLIPSLKGTSQDAAFIDVEATLFLLYNINDDSVYFESQANILLPFSAMIMQSDLMARLHELNIEEPSNRLPISTFVQYLSSNVFYFQTNEGSIHLGQVFDFIFQIIVSNDHSLSLLASKTATRLCEKCSRHLIQFLPNLEVIIFEMLKNPSTDGLIRLRMFNAFSVVARTIDDEDQFSKILLGLVTELRRTSEYVLQGIEQCGSLAEVQEEYLVSLLSCLVGVAKGSSLPDELRDTMSDETAELYRIYWQQDPVGIKPTVLSIFRFFLIDNKVVRQNPIIVEKSTLVLKAGFGEELGGPFDFGQDTVLELVETIMNDLRNPNAVPFVFGLIESFINVNFRTLTTALVDRLVDQVFVNNFDFLKSDPDLLKGTIDVFTKFVECKPALIIHSDFFKAMILPCAAEGLHANELFIIKSISKFWTQLLNMKKGNEEDKNLILSLLTNSNWGQSLSRNLIESFLKAPRSNLEPFYSLFRTLIAKFPMNFKLWLLEVVRLESIPKMPTIKERETFVNQLMVTRGRRTANDVLKAFWLKCNGLVEYNSGAL